MTVNERAIVLTDVPQGVCPSCGTRVYKAEELARVEATMKNEPVDRKLNAIRL